MGSVKKRPKDLKDIADKFAEAAGDDDVKRGKVLEGAERRKTVGTVRGSGLDAGNEDESDRERFSPSTFH